MKIFLDNKRRPPDNSWIHVENYADAIQQIEAGMSQSLDITISLCYNLGAKVTGYDVLLWIKEKVFKEYFEPKAIIIHTEDSSAKVKMHLVVNQIYKEIKSWKKKTYEMKLKNPIYDYRSQRMDYLHFTHTAVNKNQALKEYYRLLSHGYCCFRGEDDIEIKEIQS